MTFRITSSIIALLIISVISIAFTTFMVNTGNDFGLEVPEQYQDSYNNFADIEADYSEAQESVRSGEVDDSAFDIAIFTNAITAVRQLGNIVEFANTALTDLSLILGIPSFFISAFFLIIGLLTTTALIAFLANRAAAP